MGVAVVYGGTRYDLDPQYEGWQVRELITLRLNDVAQLQDDLDSRPVVLTEDDTIDVPETSLPPARFDPWVVLGLAGGGALNILVHDAASIAVIDTAEDVDSSRAAIDREMTLRRY